MADIDMQHFKHFYQLADHLISSSTKAEVAEAARLLAMNLAQYQAKFGDLPLDARQS